MVILPQRNRRYLEARFVVLFEQACRQIGRRMLAEIRRKIGNADAVMRINLAAPNRRKSRLILHVPPGALQLFGGRRRYHERRKRYAERSLLSYHRQKLSDLGVQIGPVADAQL